MDFALLIFCRFTAKNERNRTSLWTSRFKFWTWRGSTADVRCGKWLQIFTMFLRACHTFLYKIGGHVFRHFVVKPRAYCRLVAGLVGDERKKKWSYLVCGFLLVPADAKYELQGNVRENEKHSYFLLISALIFKCGFLFCICPSTVTG